MKMSVSIGVDLRSMKIVHEQVRPSVTGLIMSV